MPVYISMLRGVNLGPHNRIKMDALRALYESLKFEDPHTYVQSGNVIFRAKEKNTARIAVQIQRAIEKKLGCCPAVILRTTAEMKKAIAANPFANRRDIVPGKLLVTFLADEPASDAQSVFDKFKDYPEEIHLKGRELYIYFPNGAGKSRLPWSQVERLIKVTGTARNWNSVTKMCEMAEALENK
ncbi:MAG TPA: DUF1697 domain-containing protein [Candidatus Sulfotelmatobacter sp.]|jgi:uncharacterized protein (DUF1697 family)|nr:DUF1697 domain-containing protein [Candidatus Sulfotelmatobacter sp.]